MSAITYAENPHSRGAGRRNPRHQFLADLIGVASFAALATYLYWIAGHPGPELWSLRQAALALVAMGAIPVGYIAYRRQRRLERQQQLLQRHDGELALATEAPSRPATGGSDEATPVAAEPEPTDQPAPIDDGRVPDLAQVATRAETRDFHLRYGEAAAQLGHDKAAIRLAGVYAMAQLADEWGDTEPDQRQTCIDVLCGYLRLPMPDTEPAELRVRETVVRTITQHLQPTAPQSWSAADFDFTGADFPEGMARFDGVEFSGRVTFDRAMFSGDQTSFDQAGFSGELASFRGAAFSSARTSFDMATFSGSRTSFDRTTFSGWDTSFHDARFASSGTSFDLSSFSGRDTSFDMATFSGARVSFDAANFSTARTSFFGATFAGDFVSFGGARFSGEDSTFYLAKFRGERVTFLGANFSGAHASFNVIVGNPARETTTSVGIHARIESVLDFSDALEEGSAELDLSGAEIVGTGSVIAPKALSGWHPPPAAA